METSRSDYTQKDYGLSWSSQEWKSGTAEHDRSGKPEDISWDSMQKVDPHREELGEPTSFLDHVYLGCTQRQCEISKDIVDNCRLMFESRISAG